MNQETYKTQIVVSGEKGIDLLQKFSEEKIFAVCSKSVMKYYDTSFLNARLGNTYFFSNFSANPSYEEVENGVDFFQKQKCKVIVSVGGGSAMDVAKCIKLFSTMDADMNYLEQEKKKNDIIHIAIPTTAGTGSESTSFAVVYYKGKKQSVVHESILPDYAILVGGFLNKLPIYQKKSTVLDALCQGIESYWAVGATAESKNYARLAIKELLENINEYIFENRNHEEIMLAANKAGRAINISRTTAAHAMSYKITSMYGFSHGHAVALCLPLVWKYMIAYSEKNKEKNIIQGLEVVLAELNEIMGASDSKKAVDFFEQILLKFQMEYPIHKNVNDIEILADSVNAERLNNFPVPLRAQELKAMYAQIVR